MSNEKCNYFSLQISDTTVYIDTVSSSTYIACINYINVVIVKDTHPRLSVTNTIGCNAGKRVILMIFVYKYNLHGY